MRSQYTKYRELTLRHFNVDATFTRYIDVEMVICTRYIPEELKDLNCLNIFIYETLKRIHLLISINAKIVTYEAAFL